MDRYADCYRCKAMDGERVFSVNALKPCIFLCEECYNLYRCKFKKGLSERDYLDRIKHLENITPMQ